MSSPATMRSIVRVFTSLLLLIVLVRLSDGTPRYFNFHVDLISGSGTELSRKSRELTDEQIKDLEKLKTVMKYLKTLSNNVPTVGPYISAVRNNPIFHELDPTRIESLYSCSVLSRLLLTLRFHLKWLRSWTKWRRNWIRSWKYCKTES